MKLSIFYISLLSLSLSANSTDISDIKDSLTSGGAVDLFSKQLSPSLLKSSKVKTAELSEKLSVSQAVEALNTEITPVCPTLSTGVLYTLTAANAGDVACYHFELTEKSKTTALLVNQEVGNNVDLSILQHNIDDTFTLIGSSNNTDNTDEVVYMLSEPGHYYWYMSVIETTGAPFNFGAAVVTDLDDYEFNDTVATSTILSDKQHTIKGNMDSASDVDYFQFTAVRGQDLVINFDDNLLDEWILEIYSAGWIPIANNTELTVNNLAVNQNINVRVRANTNLPVNSLNDYTLVIGSKVDSITDHYVGGEYNVNRITYSGFGSNPYATTQVYTTLGWSVTLLDSTGYPVEGGTAVFKLDKRYFDGYAADYTDYTDVSDRLGRASGSINLGTCSGDYTYRHTDYSNGYKNIWETDMNYGIWRLEVAYGNTEEAGIGGDNVQNVILGHLCNQEIVSSNPT